MFHPEGIIWKKKYKNTNDKPIFLLGVKVRDAEARRKKDQEMRAQVEDEAASRLKKHVRARSVAKYSQRDDSCCFQALLSITRYILWYRTRAPHGYRHTPAPMLGVGQGSTSTRSIQYLVK